MHDPDPLYDVAIAGAGPVGLFLACELRLAGLSVLVLERAEELPSPLKRPPFGMRGLSVPTVEALDRRGLLDELTSAQRDIDAAADGGIAARAHWLQQSRTPGGHFAGIQFLREDVDDSQFTYRLPGPARDGMMLVAMETLESVLSARAIAMGVEIRRGRAVDGVDASDDGVTVRAGDRAFCGRWLVGCDGGRSAVRKAAGFAFTGTDPEFSGYSLDVELADPDVLEPGRHKTATGMYTYARPGTVTTAEFDGGVSHRQDITLEHAQAMLRRVSETDVVVTSLKLATTWTDRSFQATTYRSGRVLLAGDAAHTHSPLGGQGLNLGLGDAMNLGWKLAATIRGDAPAELLDSYERERHSVGARVIDWSRAQVALMRPTRSTRALDAIMRDLIATRDGATYFAERMWGVSLRYDLQGEHPLVGRSVPNFALADGMRPGTLLRDGHGLLLDFDAREFRRTSANRWPERIDYIATDAADRLGLSAALVRPDGIVAWATDGIDDETGLTVTARRWFS